MFRNWVFDNFPFLENDFDALTDYELFCKICSYVKEYSKDNEEMKAKIEEFENYFNTLDVQEEVNNKLDEMATDGTLDKIINQNIFNDLNNEITRINNSLNNRKYVFIGDSYDAQVDPSNPSSIKWWSTVIAEVLGLTKNDYIRSSVGGAAFGNYNNSFLNLIDSLSSDESVTDVLIAGGYNDQYYSYEEISNAGWDCNTLIRNKFPNARIHLAFIGNSTDSTIKASLKETLQRYIQMANAIGWHYINNAEYSMQDYFNCFLADGIHPSVYGATLIGRNLVKGLISNVADIQLPEMTLFGHSSYTDGDGVCDSFNPGNIKIYVKNGITSVSSLALSIFGFLDNVNYTPNGSNELTLGTFENGYLRGTGDLCMISIDGRAYDGTNYYDISGNLKIKNGRLLISFLCLDSTGYHDFTNLKQIAINQFSTTIPTENC